MPEEETPTKNPGGRPPFFSTLEELEARVQDYFDTGCRTKTIYVKTGKDTFEPQQMKIPTITGLVLHLGFCDRQSFYDYEEKEEFTCTIKRARTFIEQEYEELLRFNPTGAIFALKNFGWKDQTQVDHTSAGREITQYQLPNNGR